MRLNMHDNETLKWSHDGKHYLLHARKSTGLTSPRDFWGPEYNACVFVSTTESPIAFGDRGMTDNPETFWRQCVRSWVSDSELYKAIVNHQLAGVEACPLYQYPDLVSVVVLTPAGKPDMSFICEQTSLKDQLCDRLTVEQCMALMEPHAEWSAITVVHTTHGRFVREFSLRRGPQWLKAHGWVIISKEAVMNTCMTAEQQPDQLVPSFKPATEEDWRHHAEAVIMQEVAEYNAFLEGDIYDYDVYCEGSTGWGLIQSYRNFFGPNITGTPLVKAVRCGLGEAIRDKTYERGEATPKVTYEFN